MTRDVSTIRLAVKKTQIGMIPCGKYQDANVGKSGYDSVLREKKYVKKVTLVSTEAGRVRDRKKRRDPNDLVS